MRVQVLCHALRVKDSLPPPLEACKANSARADSIPIFLTFFYGCYFFDSRRFVASQMGAQFTSVAPSEGLARLWENLPGLC